MFDLKKVEKDHTSLKGAIFLAGYIPNYLTTYPKKSKDVFEQMFYIVYADRSTMLTAFRELQERYKKPLNTADLSDFLESCGDFFDGYDLGIVNGKPEWKQEISQIKNSYTLEYELQKFSPNLRIDEMVNNDVRRYFLVGLCTNFMMSVNELNHAAAQRAEERLSLFLEGQKFRTHLNDIISINPRALNHLELMSNKVNTVLSLVNEEYVKVSRLQREYEEIAGKV